jgi:uncharacterized protein (DUF302 family)
MIVLLAPGVAMPSERSADREVPEQLSEDAGEAVVTKLSPWSVADTVARLSAVVGARGMEVLAVIDHGGNAREAGLQLRDTKLVLFGSPSVATPAINAAPLAALDLPMRVAVWQDGYQTLLSYPAPAAMARRNGLEGDVANALSCIDALTNVVIDR